MLLIVAWNLFFTLLLLCTHSTHKLESLQNIKWRLKFYIFIKKYNDMTYKYDQISYVFFYKVFFKNCPVTIYSVGAHTHTKSI